MFLEQQDKTETLPMKQSFDIEFLVIEKLLLFQDCGKHNGHIARERSGLPPECVDSTGATQPLKLVLAAGL
jgi:hypothetical protein